MLGGNDFVRRRSLPRHADDGLYLRRFDRIMEDGPEPAGQSFGTLVVVVRLIRSASGPMRARR
jgi:hypothetical protein